MCVCVCVVLCCVVREGVLCESGVRVVRVVCARELYVCCCMHVCARL